MELQLHQFNAIMAMKRRTEDVEGSRFKLRTFGIPLVDENKPGTGILCDCQAVVKNLPSVDLDSSTNGVSFIEQIWNLASGLVHMK